MTLQELFVSITKDPVPILLYFALLPAAALVLNWIAKNEWDNKPWKYVYSALIFLVCLPGIFSIILCVNNFFFGSGNILNLNIFIYFLPIISMILTALIIAKEADIDQLPGFDKLSGLVAMITVTFVAMLLLQKTRIWVVFIGSATSLMVLFGVLFLVFSLAFRKVFK